MSIVVKIRLCNYHCDVYEYNLGLTGQVHNPYKIVLTDRLKTKRKKLCSLVVCTLPFEIDLVAINFMYLHFCSNMA